MSLGPLMIGLDGLTLSTEEQALLAHPLVGGVILFSRNYRSPEQLQALTQAIHQLRQPRLLIAVDHEGGRIQRFREGFSSLPAAGRLGEIHAQNPDRALSLATWAGWLMAAELRAVGVDFSFAPVVDLDCGVSSVIGDRAFHADPAVIVTLAQAYRRGMGEAGMEAVIKHYPGHGSVAADSHFHLPVDDRPYEDILASDLQPFVQLIQDGIPGVMVAHVVYPQVDQRPASVSSVWLQQILRQRLGFQGVIFTDDMDMAGAVSVGGPVERARLALEAGCDMVLACNDRGALRALLAGLEPHHDPAAQLRMIRFHGRHAPNWERLRHQRRWQQAREQLQSLVATPDQRGG